MPIWNPTHQNTAPPHDDSSQVLAGQKVDYATDINPQHRRGRHSARQGLPYKPLSDKEKQQVSAIFLKILDF
jgi:hypothetical protein